MTDQPKGMRRFTDNQARQIREDYAMGATVQEIASEHDVSPNTIYRIIRGQTYQFDAVDDECEKQHEPIPREKSAHERIDELREQFSALHSWMKLSEDSRMDRACETHRSVTRLRFSVLGLSVAVFLVSLAVIVRSIFA